MGRRIAAVALALLGCSSGIAVVGGDAAPDAPRVDAADVIAVDILPEGGADAPDVAPDAPDVAPDVVTDAPAAQGLGTPLGRWAWLDVPGSVCGDGSPTGVGVYRVENPRGVAVVLNGGGACWDEQTCFVLNTAVRGPFGAAQLDALAPNLAGTLLDPANTGRPFERWTVVLVPSCTGDMFLGDRAVTFSASRGWAFRGRSNLSLALARVAAATPERTPVAVLGVSVGGVGALYSHALIRERLPRNPLYVLSDSGALLDPGPGAAPLRARWFDAWGAGWIDARCPGCRADPTAIFARNAAEFPADRTGFAGSTQDAVMRTLQGASAQDYEAALRAAVATFAAAPTRRAFVVAGAAHALTASRDAVTAGDGAALLPWIEQMLADDPGWSSHPP